MSVRLYILLRGLKRSNWLFLWVFCLFRCADFFLTHTHRHTHTHIYLANTRDMNTQALLHTPISYPFSLPTSTCAHKSWKLKRPLPLKRTHKYLHTNKFLYTQIFTSRLHPAAWPAPPACSSCLLLLPAPPASSHLRHAHLLCGAIRETLERYLKLSSLIISRIPQDTVYDVTEDGRRRGGGERNGMWYVSLLQGFGGKRPVTQMEGARDQKHPSRSVVGNKMVGFSAGFHKSGCK